MLRSDSDLGAEHFPATLLRKKFFLQNSPEKSRIILQSSLQGTPTPSFIVLILFVGFAPGIVAEIIIYFKLRLLLVAGPSHARGAKCFLLGQGFQRLARHFFQYHLKIDKPFT